MMRRISAVLVFLALGGCAALTGQDPRSAGDMGADGSVRPQARPDGVAPSATARTEEDFDTTTSEEREAAQAPSAGAERALGRTVASLGSPSEPGFWLKTPLVRQEGPGRVVDPATGKSVQVTLIPIDGPATAGSRMSLPALRLLGASLAGLTDVEVYSGG